MRLSCGADGRGATGARPPGVVAAATRAAAAPAGCVWRRVRRSPWRSSMLRSRCPRRLLLPSLLAWVACGPAHAAPAPTEAAPTTPTTTATTTADPRRPDHRRPDHRRPAAATLRTGSSAALPRRRQLHDARTARCRGASRRGDRGAAMAQPQHPARAIDPDAPVPQWLPGRGHRVDDRRPPLGSTAAQGGAHPWATSMCIAWPKARHRIRRSSWSLPSVPSPR